MSKDQTKELLKFLKPFDDEKKELIKAIDELGLLIACELIFIVQYH